MSDYRPGQIVATTNASLARGEEVEILEDLGDGWFEVRPTSWRRGSVDIDAHQVRWVVDER